MLSGCTSDVGAIDLQSQLFPEHIVIYDLNHSLGFVF